MGLRVTHATLRSLLTRLLAQPGARLLARLGLTPTMVTLLGLLLSGGTAYLVASGRLIPGGILLLVSASFDFLVGALARLTGRATAFGALLDSVADRVSEAAVLLGVLLLALDRDEPALAVLAFLALVASLLVSYVRARAEGLGVQGEVGLLARPERVLLLAAGLLADQLAIALGVIAALGFVTALHRMLHARWALKGDRRGPS
jgi:CDP-diacylglycerol--glycerol-3-phosphate 3-phosphatidyltransferase